MFQPSRGLAVLLAATALGAPALVACSSGGSGSGSAGSGGTRTVTIELTRSGCAPHPATVPAGSTTFEITNTGAGAVTEAELVQDGRILGERESLTPGLSGSFTLDLEPGHYQIYCPGAEQERFEFTVTENAAAADDPSNPALGKATAAYHARVVERTA